MKKILLLFNVLFILYFSNTPELRVIEPSTWINPPDYETQVNDLSFLFDTKGLFYLPYQIDDTENLDFYSHKISHMVFYTLLTYLVFINLRFKKLKRLTTFIVVCLFSLTDEIHQYFIVGRSGRMVDVILDSSMSFLTILVITLIVFLRDNRKNKEEKMETKYKRKQS